MWVTVWQTSTRKDRDVRPALKRCDGILVPRERCGLCKNVATRIERPGRSPVTVGRGGGRTRQTSAHVNKQNGRSTKQVRLVASPCAPVTHISQVIVARFPGTPPDSWFVLTSRYLWNQLYHHTLAAFIRGRFESTPAQNRVPRLQVDTTSRFEIEYNSMFRSSRQSHRRDAGLPGRPRQCRGKTGTPGHAHPHCGLT